MGVGFNGFSNVVGNLSGLPRILAALGTGGISELAINAKQNLDQQNAEATGIDAGSGIPAFAYKEQTPDEINQAKGKQLANLGTAPAMALYENYRNDPITSLTKEEKKAQILNLQQEASLRGEQIKKARTDDRVQQSLMQFRQNLFPTLVEPSAEPQGPADMSGATLPAIPSHITTDPEKLQQAATASLLMGDTATAEGLNKMQRNRNLNLQDQAKIDYYNAKAKGADTTTVTPSVVDASGVPVTGEEYLKAIPAERAVRAKNLVEGKGLYPTGTYAKSPAGQQLIADALQYDPELDANTFKKRGAAQIAYGSGTQGKNVVALKTAIDHLLALSDAANKLTDTGSKATNSILNSVEGQFGGTGITNYNTILHTAAPEIVKAYVPTGGTEKDRETMISNFSSNLTKKQKQQAIATQAELMTNRLEQLQNGYDEAMGRAAKPLVSPEARAKLEALRGGTTTPAQKASEIQKSAPQANAAKVFTRINGKLVQVK